MSAELSPTQHAMRAGQIDLCLHFGIGGSAWTRTRTSDGDELLDEQPTTSTAPIVGYLRTLKPATILLSAPGAPAAPKRLRFFDFGPRDEATGAHTFEPQDLAPGDTLTSLADSSIRINITGQDLAAGYGLYIIERHP